MVQDRTKVTINH